MSVPTPPSSLADLILHHGMPGDGDIALRYRTQGIWENVSYGAFRQHVAQLARGFIDLGVETGDRIALMAATRPEWTYVHAAALCTGAIFVPIYPTSSVEEVSHILADSAPQIVVVETDKELDVVSRAHEASGTTFDFVIMESSSGSRGPTLTVDEVARCGNRNPIDLSARVGQISPDAPASIIYTSGTTGTPKGCVLTHTAWLACVTGTASELPLQRGESGYLYLPLAHAFGHLVELVSFQVGGCLIFASDGTNRIADDLRETGPDYLPTAPRLLEKVYSSVRTRADCSGGLTGAVARWAITNASRRDPVRRGLAAGVLRKQLRAALGGRLKLCVTGSAPISPELLDFFATVGVSIVESYGMTEAPAICMNRVGEERVGSVGRALPGIEVRARKDGELVILGASVLSRYWNRREESRSALLGGWLHTGDIGVVDSDGYVTITGRKKEIMITASGKNVAPASIEAALEKQPGVSQAFVTGDGRPYVAALLVPEEQTARGNGTAYVEAAVEAVNATISKAAQIKCFALVETPFTEERGELTVTQKLKRPVIEKMRAAEIGGLYP